MISFEFIKKKIKNTGRFSNILSEVYQMIVERYNGKDMDEKYIYDKYDANIIILNK